MVARELTKTYLSSMNDERRCTFKSHAQRIAKQYGLDWERAAKVILRVNDDVLVI